MPAARSLFILRIVIGKKPTVGAAVLILKVDSPNWKNYNVDERLWLFCSRTIMTFRKYAFRIAKGSFLLHMAWSRPKILKGRLYMQKKYLESIFQNI